MEDETTLPPPPPLAPSPYAPLVVPIILAAVFNLIVPGIFGHSGPSEFVAAFVAGLGAGQFGLLATWAVLGPWRLYSQWFVALLVGLGLFLVFVAAMSMVEPSGAPPGNIFLVMILVMLAVLVAAQAPLWCVRLFRGWRLVLRGTDAARTVFASRQLQIRDILIAMTILALFLGTLSRAAKGINGHNNVTEFLAIVLASCGVVVVWSALVLPICLWVCFGASAIGVRIVVLMGYVVTMATIAIGVVLAVSRREPPPEAIFFFLLLHAGLLATVLCGLGLARACGYVLVSVRTARCQPLPAPAPPSAPGEEPPA